VQEGNALSLKLWSSLRWGKHEDGNAQCDGVNNWTRVDAFRKTLMQFEIFKNSSIFNVIGLIAGFARAPSSVASYQLRQVSYTIPPQVIDAIATVPCRLGEPRHVTDSTFAV
jgi:hypothetical protein